jgi:hypothetical protein
MSPDSTRPEYSPEQVEASVERVLRQMVNGPLPDEDTATVIVDSESFLNLHSDIRTILSALAKADDSRAEWERTANAFAADVVGYVEEIASLRSRLESAERDTAIVDWLLAVGFITVDGKAPDVHPTRDNLRSCMEQYAAHSPTPTQGGTNGR